jgi:O-antigen ligase
MENIEEQNVILKSSGAHRIPASQSETTWRTRMLLFFERAIFFAALFLIPLTAIPYGTVEPWWEALFQCLIFTLVALWIVEGMLRGAWRVSGLSLLAPALAIVAYAFVQTLPLRSGAWQAISADPYGTRLVALKLLALTLAGALLLRYTSSRRRLRALIYAVLVTAVVSAIFGIVRETTHHNTTGFGLPQLKPGVGYGQFINRNHFAYLMEMALGLSLGLMLGRGEKRARLLYIAAALPVWMGLVLANSRGGILSMLTELLFLILVYGIVWQGQGNTESEYGVWRVISRLMSRLPVRIILIAGLLGAMIAGVLWIGGDPLAKRLETLQSEVGSEGITESESARRIQIWQASWKIFKAHPVTGIGFGSYWVAITEYYDVPGQKRPYEAHNDYLELLDSGGIIGVALGLWLMIALVKRVRKTLRTKDALRRAACLGALTGLFGVAVHSLVDFGLQITVNALVCVALLVIATAEERVEDAPVSAQRELRQRPQQTGAA